MKNYIGIGCSKEALRVEQEDNLLQERLKDTEGLELTIQRMQEDEELRGSPSCQPIPSE